MSVCPWPAAIKVHLSWLVIIKVSSCVIDLYVAASFLFTTFFCSSSLLFSHPSSSMLPTALHFHKSIVIKHNLIVPSHAHSRMHTCTQNTHRSNEVLLVQYLISVLPNSSEFVPVSSDL